MAVPGGSKAIWYQLEGGRERNIRTAGCIIWRENRPMLEQLACRPLKHKPHSAQMLAILSSNLLSPLAVHGLGEAAAFAGVNDDVGVFNKVISENIHQSQCSIG